VGHNCLFDVSYGLYGFADSYLPSTWRDFKKMARSWHPGGIWDTKYIARQLPEVRLQHDVAAWLFCVLVGGVCLLTERGSGWDMDASHGGCQW
jgi:poly(A)-specific ribonuclease